MGARNSNPRCWAILHLVASLTRIIYIVVTDSAATKRKQVDKVDQSLSTRSLYFFSTCIMFCSASQFFTLRGVDLTLFDCKPLILTNENFISRVPKWKERFIFTSFVDLPWFSVDARTPNSTDNCLVPAVCQLGFCCKYFLVHWPHNYFLFGRVCSS